MHGNIQIKKQNKSNEKAMSKQNYLGCLEKAVTKFPSMAVQTDKFNHFIF